MSSIRVNPYENLYQCTVTKQKFEPARLGYFIPIDGAEPVVFEDGVTVYCSAQAFTDRVRSIAWLVDVHTEGLIRCFPGGSEARNWWGCLPEDVAANYKSL